MANRRSRRGSRPYVTSRGASTARRRMRTQLLIVLAVVGLLTLLLLSFSSLGGGPGATPIPT